MKKDVARVTPRRESFDRLVEDLQERVKESEFPLTPRTGPEFLSKFIRGKNYDTTAALSSVRKYYANIHRNLDFLGGIRPSDLTTILNSQTIVVLKDRLRGSKVAVLRVKYWNPKEVPLREIQLAGYLLGEEALKDPQTQENGILFIMDLAGTTFEQAWKLSVKELRRIFVTVQEGLPVRVVGIHFLHPPPFFWPIYKIATTVMKRKIQDRVQLHFDLESLHESVPVEILPESLGGDLEDPVAFETYLFDTLLGNNVPYEEYWNGNLVRV